MNLKICIVTFYRSMNPGGTLQAYAMQKVLEGLGHSVFLCKQKTTVHNTLKTAKGVALALFVKRRLAAATAQLQRLFLSKKAFRLFTEISPKQAVSEGIDCYLLGSDTIWDLRAQKHGHKNREHLFGSAFQGSKVISYAPSAGNVTLDIYKREGFRHGDFDHIDSIAVRDEHTKGIVETFTAASVTVVCDPTMLPAPEIYDFFCQSPPDIGKYIALYLYEPLSGEARKELRLFAEKSGCKFVSLTREETKYSDFVKPCEPWNFIKYFKYADFVVTDTFHGSVFSIIFNKQFVAIKRGRKKVANLLKQFDLSSRLVENNESAILVLGEKIDWATPNSIMSDMRAMSLRYLNEALDV